MTPLKTKTALVKPKHFANLKDRLCLIRDDFTLYANGLTPFRVLDFFVLFSVCRLGDAGLHRRIVRYAYESDLVTQATTFIMPASYWEMGENIAQLQDYIKDINSQEVQLLSTNTLFSDFAVTLRRYYGGQRNGPIRAELLSSFRRVLFNNDDQRIPLILRKAITLFFYDKLYLDSYEEMLRLLGSKQHTRAKIGNIINDLGKPMLPYRSDTCKKCYAALKRRRGTPIQDAVDALCYGTCLEMAQKLTEKGFRPTFFTSDTPFSAFYPDKSIHQGKPVLVRDSLCLGLERFILERNEGDFERAIDDINRTLPQIAIALKSKVDIEVVEVRGELRRLYRDQFTHDVLSNAAFCHRGAVVFADLLNEEETEAVLENEDLFNTWVSTWITFVDQIERWSELEEATLDAYFHEESKRVVERVDSVLEFLYKIVTQDEGLEEEYTEVEKKIHSLTQQEPFHDSETILDGVEATFLSLMEEPEKGFNEEKLKESVYSALSISKVKEDVANLLIDSLYWAYEIKHLRFAAVLQDILREAGIKYEWNRGDN